MCKQCLPTIPPIQQHEQLPLTSNQPELGQTQTSDRVKLYGKMYKFISTFTVKFYFIFYNHLTNLNSIINSVLRIIS